MGTKYPSQSITGYNSSPPPDDGSQVSGNVVEWDKHVTKLSDPVKTLAESINSALITHLDEGPDSKTASYATTLTDYGKVIEFNGSGFTCTLLAPATAGSGYRVTIKNLVSSGNLTVVSGSGTIDADASVILAPGTSTTFMVNSGASVYQRIHESIPSSQALIDQSSGSALTPATNLTISRTSASQVLISCDKITLFNSGGEGRVFGSMGQTINVAVAGENGLDTGTEQASVFYHMWVIGKVDGTLGAVFSLQYPGVGTPTLPAGYTFFGYVGAIYNDTVPDFLFFYQSGNKAWMGQDSTHMQLISAGTATTATAVSTSAQAPLTASAFNVAFNAKSATPNVASTYVMGLGGFVNFSDARGNVGWHFQIHSGSSSSWAHATIPQIQAGALYYLVNGTGASTEIVMQGWEF